LHSPALLAQCNFRIECELPNANMHNFEGLLFVDDEQGLALTKDQVMLRGSSLQNTGRAFGVCIGAGRQTKLFLNSSDPPYKRTHVEQEMNRQMYVVFVLLGVLCTLGASISGTKLRDLGSLETYLQYAASKLTSSAIATQAISDFFNFAVLYAYMVPISLYVSLELVKLVQVWHLVLYSFLCFMF
jgi:magnesium-transporting ATPase (P-type)